MNEKPREMSPPDRERYSRQILFPPIGVEGQRALMAAYAVVVGCGGLGTVLAETLARAGVGRLLVVDRDCVEMSNLQRQVLFDESDVAEGLPKAEAAGRKLRAINSRIEISTRVADVNPWNVESIVEGADLVLDGLDNFETRFLLNDACVKHGIPWIYGACVASQGTTMTILPGRTACLRCVFESAPAPGSTPTCDTAGIIAPAVNVIASLEVAEALKILTGRENEISTKLRTFDVWSGRLHEIEQSRFRAGGKCPACVEGRFDYLESRKDSETTLAAAICGRGAMQVTPRGARDSFDLVALSARLALLGKVAANRFLLKFESSEVRFTVFPDGRAILQDVDDTARARSLYARYIGS